MAGRGVSGEMWLVYLRAPDAAAQEVLNAGMKHRDSYNYPAALTEFDRLVTYCADYAEGWNQRAYIHFLRENYAAALPDLDEALRLNPYHVAASSGRALKGEPSWTLRMAFNEYQRKVLVPKGTVAGTIQGNTNLITTIEAMTPQGMTLDDWDDEIILELSAAMSDEDFAANTRQNTMILLGTLMRFARRLNKMTAPLPEFPKIKIPKKKPRFIGAAQEDPILNHFTTLGDEDMHDLCVFLCDTGLRVGKEAIPLVWDAINFKEGKVYVREGKGGKHRTVAMTLRVRSTLRRRRLKGITKGPFDGLNYHAMSTRWGRRMDAMDWTDEDRKKLSLHIWRHTFCARMVSAGIDLRTVQELAGHSNIQTTMGYSHFVPTNVNNALAALENRGQALEETPVRMSLEQ